MESVKRNTACKVWIADLISGEYSKGLDQFDAGVVNVRGIKVSRVNIMGSIIDRFEGEGNISFNLDDGSGILKLRSWNDGSNLFSDVEIGDLVILVGKVKQYNGIIYVAPEIIRKLDNPLWLKIRKLELVKLYGEVKRVEVVTNNIGVQEEEMTMNVVEEKISSGENYREVVLSLIEKLDFGDGADLDEVVKKSGFSGANKLVTELLLDGEVFELHKGKLRVMG